jgi:organic radical activating enzyme
VKVATISVTDSCPLNCSSCYSKKSQNSMTLQDFKGIIYKLPPTIEAITITGGEPFVLSRLFLEILWLKCVNIVRKTKSSQ